MHVNAQQVVTDAPPPLSPPHHPNEEEARVVARQLRAEGLSLRGGREHKGKGSTNDAANFVCRALDEDER